MMNKHDGYIDETLAEIREWLLAPGRLAPCNVSPLTRLEWSISKYDGEYRAWIVSDIDAGMSPMIDVESMTPIDILIEALCLEEDLIKLRAETLKEVIRDAEEWE